MEVLESRRCSTFRTHFRITKMKTGRDDKFLPPLHKKKYRSFFREPETHGVHRDRCT